MADEENILEENNNKYLAIGEVDYSGTIIKSYVKIISVELAKTDPDNSIIYTYESNNGEYKEALEAAEIVKNANKY